MRRRGEEAAEDAEAAVRLDPHAVTAHHTAGLLFLLVEMRDRASREWAASMPLSMLSWQLGEHDEALRWLRVAIDERDFTLPLAAQLPVYRAYANDPAIAALLAGVGPVG